MGVAVHPVHMEPKQDYHVAGRERLPIVICLRVMLVKMMDWLMAGRQAIGQEIQQSGLLVVLESSVAHLRVLSVIRLRLVEVEMIVGAYAKVVQGVLLQWYIRNVQGVRYMSVVIMNIKPVVSNANNEMGEKFRNFGLLLLTVFEI